MRRGQASWTTEVPPHELQAINDWIDSEADYRAADIYRALGVRRYCAQGTFRRYVSRRRTHLKARAEEGSLPPSSFSLDLVEDMARGALGKALLTGEMPAYALPNVLQAISKMDRAYTARAAERRAREWHEAKAKQMSKDLDEVAQASELTPEQVAEIRQRVLGL